MTTLSPSPTPTPLEATPLAELREQRALVSRLLAEAMTERKNAHRERRSAAELACRDALVGRLLARITELDTQLVKARLSLEHGRTRLEADVDLAFRCALGLGA